MKCPQCGKDLSFVEMLGMTSVCRECQADPTRAKSDVPDRATTTSGPNSRPVVNRYRDGYRVATFLVTVGQVIKIVGAAFGFLLMVVPSSSSNPFQSSGLSLLGVVSGAMVAGVGFVLGMLVAAQGQILQATLDTSVSASRFLTDTERAAAMGLGSTVFETDKGPA